MTTVGASPRRGMRRWAALAAVVLLATAPVLGRPAAPPSSGLAVDGGPLLFERIGNRDQVPDNVVSGIAQDGEGLLWIATTGGLVRFDGYRFRLYRADDADPRCLPGNVVRVVHRDRAGRIWVGTESDGVARYDPVTDRFDRFGEAEGVALLPVRALADDADGGLWIGSTGGGLRRLDPDRRQTEVWRHDPADAGSLPDDRISALLADRDGAVWIGTWRGLARHRIGSGRFEPVLSEPGDPLGFSAARIRVIAQVASGDLWIGAQQGQAAVLPHEVLASDVPPPSRVAIRWQGTGFSAVSEPLPGEVWVGHAGGIAVHAADDARLLRDIVAVPGQTLGLDPAEIRALTVDASGLLWVGSFGGGVQRTDPRPRGLVSRRLRPQSDPPLPQFNVLTMAEDGEGGAWLGLAGVGVARLRPDLRLGEVLRPTGIERGGFEGDQPAGVAATDDGALWVATERGLFLRPKAGGAFRQVPGFLEGATVRRLWPARDGSLWAGTADGLFQITADGRSARRLADARGEPVTGSSEALDFDGRGGWVGGTHGLSRLDPHIGTLHRVETRVDGVARMLDVDGLLVDASGGLWLDANGLYRARAASEGVVELESVSARHGEEGVSFGANLLDDDRGRLWTQRAMFDPGSDEFRELLPADGAQIGTGWFRSFARLDGGRLAFGGREGVLVATPEAFVPWRYRPPTRITDVWVDGQRQPIGPAATELRVSPGQQRLSIEFASIDFSAPERNRHRYRLEGVDAEWIETPSESRVAAYGNLWPGRYVFLVQGGNRDGEWSPVQRTLDIIVEPNWWQTPAFLIAAVALATLVALALVRWRTRALERARRRLESEVARRTAELEVLSEALRARTREFEEASLTDPLTGLRNRRFMSAHMDAEMALWGRREAARPSGGVANDMAVFLVDIDHFKAVNDRHGHATGDELLRQFAARLREVFRASDHLVRWGGEEFLVVARDTPREAAAELAERLRQAVASHPFVHGDAEVVLTVSVGWAPLPWDTASPAALGWEAIVALADLALYTVKQAGRDGWLGLLPHAPLPPGADLAWLMKRLPRMVASGDLRLASNLNLDRLAHLIASQAT